MVTDFFCLSASLRFAWRSFLFHFAAKQVWVFASTDREPWRSNFSATAAVIYEASAAASETLAVRQREENFGRIRNRAAGQADEHERQCENSVPDHRDLPNDRLQEVV
jgi:hypothetical protein